MCVCVLPTHYSGKHHLLKICSAAEPPSNKRRSFHIKNISQLQLNENRNPLRDAEQDDTEYCSTHAHKHSYSVQLYGSKVRADVSAQRAIEHPVIKTIYGALYCPTLIKLCCRSTVDEPLGLPRFKLFLLTERILFILIGYLALNI